VCNSVNASKFALAGVSAKRRLKPLRDAGVEVGGDEVALADYVELAVAVFTFPKEMLETIWSGEIVLPIADLRFGIGRERLLGFRNSAGGRGVSRQARSDTRRVRGLFVEETR